MTILDLDQNEVIEVIKVSDKIYKIGDLTLEQQRKIRNIKTGFFRPRLELQRRRIIPDILSRLNEDTDISKRTTSNIAAFVSLITKRLNG